MAGRVMATMTRQLAINIGACALLLANRADQRFPRQFPQLRIQGSAGYPAPYLGVGQFAGPADLVTVHRSALG